MSSNNIPSAKESDNAVPKRKRLNQACESCRRKKVKCDGSKPSCRNCSRLQLACTYVAGSRRGRAQGTIPTKNKTKKTAAAAAAASMLAPPVSSTGSVILPPMSITMNNQTALVPMHSVSGPISTTLLTTSAQITAALTDPAMAQASSTTTNTSNPSSRSPSAPHNSVSPEGKVPLRDQLARAMSLDRVCSNPNIQIRQSMVEALERNLEECCLAFETTLNLGNTSGLTYQSPFFPKLPGKLHSNSLAPSPKTQANPKSIAMDDSPTTPPPSVETSVNTLVDLFFRFGHWMVPVLDQVSFMNDLEAQHLSPALLYSVCTFATTFMEASPSVKDHHTQYFSQQVVKALSTSQQVPSQDMVQTLIIMAYHASATANYYQAWNYGGQATRMALALGLHVLDGAVGANIPAARNIPDDNAILERSRRLFWVCFLFDRFWSLALGFSPAIDEREICLCLPQPFHDWCANTPGYHMLYEHDEILSAKDAQNMETIKEVIDTPPLGPDALVIKLVTYLGDIVRIRNRSGTFFHSHAQQIPFHFDVLDNRLGMWALSLPEYLSYANVVSSNTMPLSSTGQPLSHDQLSRWKAYLLFIHAFYHIAVMFLHRCRIVDDINPHPSIHCIPEDSDASFDRCHQSMQYVCEIAHHCLSIDARLLSPFLPFTFYHAALFLIAYADRIKPENFITHQEQISRLRNALHHSQKQWKISQLYLQVLNLEKTPGHSFSDEAIALSHTTTAAVANHNSMVDIEASLNRSLLTPKLPANVGDMLSGPGNVAARNPSMFPGDSGGTTLLNSALFPEGTPVVNVQEILKVLTPTHELSHNPLAQLAGPTDNAVVVSTDLSRTIVPSLNFTQQQQQPTLPPGDPFHTGPPVVVTPANGGTLVHLGETPPGTTVQGPNPHVRPGTVVPLPDTTAMLPPVVLSTAPPNAGAEVVGGLPPSLGSGPPLGLVRHHSMHTTNSSISVPIFAWQGNAPA
ncbi:hypothetical protein IWQ61_009874, partial [Dispira simplex]